MKIAFFVSGFPSRTETFIVNQIAGLLDRGHDVHIFANEIHDEAELHAEFRGYDLLRRVRRRRSAASPSRAGRLSRRLARLWNATFRHPAIALRAVNPMKYGRRALSLDILDMALHFVDRPSYDVVHCHFGPNGNDAAVLMELGLLEGRLLATFHSYDVLIGLESRGAVYRPLIRRADAIHSISEYNRRSLERIGFAPERIVHHPMGIDVSRLGARAGRTGAAGETVILSVARLAPAKGLGYALEAIAELRRRRAGLRLRYRVIGGGPLRQALVEQARRLGVGDIVEFLGPQDQEVVRAALREADLFLLPSLAEALPLAIMEAMACGLPVVATDVGGVRELVRDGETGRLVPPGDAGALARALSELLDVRATWQRLGEAGRSRVTTRHDIEALNDRLVAHYRRIAADGPPGAAGRAVPRAPQSSEERSEESAAGAGSAR